VLRTRLVVAKLKRTRNTGIFAPDDEIELLGAKPPATQFTRYLPNVENLGQRSRHREALRLT